MLEVNLTYTLNGKKKSEVCYFRSYKYAIDWMNEIGAKNYEFHRNQMQDGKARN